LTNIQAIAFQTGLFGTWMHPQYPEDAKPKDLYNDIEGGLGWSRDTRFPTTTPKFDRGGVGVNFHDIANGPAYGRGTWEDPRGLYGVAPLTPWLLFPLDGLNLKQGVAGEVFGLRRSLPMPFFAQPEAKSRRQGRPDRRQAARRLPRHREAAKGLSASSPRISGLARPCSNCPRRRQMLDSRGSGSEQGVSRWRPSMARPRRPRMTRAKPMRASATDFLSGGRRRHHGRAAPAHERPQRLV
jgi:hypothetical protein